MVRDSAGQTVFTGNSDADGAFAFDLTFHAAGTYHYTIGELDSGASGGENPGITYDDSTYSLTVTVTDDGAVSYTHLDVYKRQQLVGLPAYDSSYRLWRQ